MKDVANRAGVAIGTVSNVLNRPHLVADQTRHKVEAAIADLGFVRNSAARSLAAGVTTTVGLVLVDIGNSFFVDIARGAEAATAKAGLNLLLANSDVDQSRQDSYLELFDEARAAGLLLAPLDGPLTTAYRVQGHGRPVILVNVPAMDEAACSVVANDELGGRLAAQHLISQGCAQLAFVGGPLQLRAVRHRLQGAQQAADRAGVPLRVIETHNLKIAPGREAAEQLLRSDTAVDGIICASDLLAIGVIAAVSDLGLRVPDDLAVIGYDDNHFAAESTIPISTIAQPGYRMGEMAAELLLDELGGSHERHQAILLDPHLIARRSSQRARVPEQALLNLVDAQSPDELTHPRRR
jgi:LacI family transcriptional regulator